MLLGARARRARADGGHRCRPGCTGEGAVGDLRVGTFQSAATHLLPHLLVAFREAWPRIEVTLFESGSHDEIDGQVERGALDLAFTHPPIPDGAPLDFTELVRRSLCPGGGTGPPARRRGRFGEPRDARGDRSRGVPRLPGHAEVERFMRSHGIEPRVVFRAEDNHLLQGLAAKGIGAAIMPALAIDRSRDDVVLLELDGFLADVSAWSGTAIGIRRPRRGPSSSWPARQQQTSPNGYRDRWVRDSSESAAERNGPFAFVSAWGSSGTSAPDGLLLFESLP